MLSFQKNLPNLKSKIRILNAAAGYPALDIYNNDQLLFSNMQFSDISDYIEISPGELTLTIYKTGDFDTPLSYEEIVVLPQTSVTISLVLEESSLVSLSLTDGSKAKNLVYSNLRFINLSTNSPLLSLSLPNGNTLFNGVEYLENTNYYNLSGGIYDFEITATNDSSFRKFINNVNLKSNTYHTIYLIGLIDGTPTLGYILTKDSKYNE